MAPFRLTDRLLPGHGFALRYLAVLAFLLVAFLLTLGLRTWQIDRAESRIDEMRERSVRRALAYVQRDFTARQRDLLERARTLARDDAVVHGLRILSRGERDGAEIAASLFQRLEGDESIELYDVMPRLVAWNGFSMPLDDGPQRLQFLESSQVSIVSDDEWRTALVAWWPVTDGRRALGAVRVMELVEVRVPLENQYLHHESIARAWRNATGRPVDVQFGIVSTRPGELEMHQQVLQGVDGTPLGVISILPPGPAELVAAVARRYEDVAAFWATLLLLWGLAGLFPLYRSARSRLEIAGAGLLVAVAWWGVRAALLALDVPARWQTGKAPLAPLFDPTRLASTAGFGLLQSAGDVVITAVFGVLFAGLLVHWFHAYVQTNRHGSGLVWRSPGVLGLSLAGAAVSAATVAAIALLASVVQRVVMDSTLDYFARSGIIPGKSEWLVATVFASLLLLTLSFLILGTALMGWWLRLIATYRGGTTAPQLAASAVGTGLLVPLVVAYLGFGFGDLVPWPAAIAFLAVCSTAGYLFFLRSGQGFRLLTLRGVLLSVFMLAVLLYPMYYSAVDMKRRIQMIDVADSFDEGRDPSVVFGIEQVLAQMANHPRVTRLLTEPPSERARVEIDAVASQYLRASLLASLGPYDVSVSVLTPDGRVAGRNDLGSPIVGRTVADQIDSTEFDVLRAMYAAADADGPLIDRITGIIERDRMQYMGVVPVTARPDTLGWVMARVRPQTLYQYSETPFPRVLLPQGMFSNIQASLSLAEFRNGVLVRSLGRSFGRYRLDEGVEREIARHSEYWTREDVEERAYLTYYKRKERTGVEETTGPALIAGPPAVVAARVPATNTFDHLYYLLRLTVAGLLLSIPLHLVGMYLRWRAGLLPAERVPFRDKVLNAFLSVGIISVAAVGFVGGEVVEEGTEASVRSSLQQHLERVEQTLALESRAGEFPYRTLERVGIDSLSARVGVDLNVYRNWQLFESSRPQLIRERLLDTRLPIEAYVALYHEGYRFTTSTEHIGTFEYKAGYRTLLDEQGMPKYVVSVPILPEQERIEEEQARTIAYLFGALLILVLVVMFTASVLANALARPIGRLRAGLEAVARGRFERSIPVQSRDEVGELVETFNAMQEQLAESRRKLAQQERQLAWREMARQVAHEIKNPLTPMKLSVQHLRRAFEPPSGAPTGGGRDGKFAAMFDRVTSTLIEQINTLARIADEFSSYAKLPTRVREALDLNAVIEQAADLMREEQAAEVVLELSEEPLIVSADREELRRVYINLIKNAFQAVPEDRPGVVVIASRFTENEIGERQAWSTVADNGTGIPAELRERIFEPNFSTKTSGMGLGLAIVRKSIEDMQGEIGFETEEGEGTTFWIRLPLADQDEDESGP